MTDIFFGGLIMSKVFIGVNQYGELMKRNILDIDDDNLINLQFKSDDLNDEYDNKHDIDNHDSDQDEIDMH